MKFHKNIESISIYQYFKLFETGDLRYLLFLQPSEIYNLPEITDFTDLHKANEVFFNNLKDVDNLDQLKKIKLLKSFAVYIGDEKHVKHHKLFTDYLKYLNDKNVSFIYDDKNWNDTFKFYEYLRNKLKDEIYIKRVEIFLNLEFKQTETFDFYQNIAEINKAGYSIDINRDSWALYLGILKSIKDAVKRNRKKNKKN